MEQKITCTKIRLHFYSLPIMTVFVFTLFLMFHLFNRIIDSTPILACPSDRYLSNLLSAYHSYLICDTPSLSCKNVDIVFSGKTVIVIYDDYHWNLLSVVLERLSDCGVKAMAVHVSKSMPEYSCSSDQKISIITITDTDMSFLLERLNLPKCSFNHLAHNYTIIHDILTRCPYTLWFFGDHNNCLNQSISTKMLKVYRLTVDDIVLSDNILKVGTMPYGPFVKKTIDETGRIEYTGIVMEILEKIESTFNLKFQYIEPVDQSFGAIVNETYWNGLVGMAQRAEVDFVAASLTVTYARQNVVDFSSPYFFEDMGVLTQMPSSKSHKFWRIIYLFTPIVWFSIFLSVFIGSMYVFILHKVKCEKTKSGFESYANCLWYFYSGLVNQGGEMETTLLSAKSFLMIWWVYIFLITSVYSGCLIAVVTKGGIPLQFSDLGGLLKAVQDGKYKLCTRGNVAFHEAIMNDQKYLPFKIFLEKNPSYLAAEDECAKKLKVEQDVAMIGELTILKEIQIRECLQILPRKMILLNDRFFNRYFAFAFPRKSVLKELISREISDIKDSGIIPLWRNRHVDRPKFCQILNPDDIVSEENQPLEIYEIAGAFILFTIGIICSASSFYVEKMYLLKKKLAIQLPVNNKILY